MLSFLQGKEKHLGNNERVSHLNPSSAERLLGNVNNEKCKIPYNLTGITVGLT